MKAVYRFKKWDITADRYVESRRWGTRDAVKKASCVVIEGTEITVDEANLDADGFTKDTFKP